VFAATPFAIAHQAQAFLHRFFGFDFRGFDFGGPWYGGYGGWGW
jgi:hypothetical protein